jgi:hypothetical protein
MAERPQDQQHLTGPNPPATPEPRTVTFRLSEEDKKDVAKVRIMPATRVVTSPQPANP